MRRLFCRFVYWLIEPLLERLDRRRRMAQIVNESTGITLGFQTDQSSEPEHRCQ